MVVVVSRFASAHRHQLLHQSQECVPLSPWADVRGQVQPSLNPCSSFPVSLPLRTSVTGLARAGDTSLMTISLPPLLVCVHAATTSCGLASVGEIS